MGKSSRLLASLKRTRPLVSGAVMAMKITAPKTEDEHFAYNCPDAPEELRENARRRLLVGDYENDDDGLRLGGK